MRARRWAWAALLAAAGAAYLFENNPGTLTLLLCYLALPLVGMLALLGGGRLAVQGPLPQTLEKGKAVECRLIVKNGGMVPVLRLRVQWRCRNLHTGETRSGVETVTLPPKGERSLPFTLRGRHCGSMELQVLSGEVEDLFGLVRRRVELTWTGETAAPPVLFAPELIFLPAERRGPERQTDSRTVPGDDPGEFYAIREYVPGDAVRQIHWKLSEKTGKTMVRLLGASISREALLLFDPTGADPELTDIITEIFASLAWTLAERDFSFAVCWADPQSGEPVVTEIDTREDLGPMLDRLLALPPGNRPCPWPELEEYSRILAIAAQRPALEGREGVRVSLLLPRELGLPEGTQGDGSRLYTFSREDYSRDLSRLEV